jgi:hypothetical protein
MVTSSAFNPPSRPNPIPMSRHPIQSAPQSRRVFKSAACPLTSPPTATISPSHYGTAAPPSRLPGDASIKGPHRTKRGGENGRRSQPSEPHMVDEEATRQPTGKEFAARAWWRRRLGMPRRWEEGTPTPAASNLSVVAESGLKEEAATNRRRTFSPSFYPRRHASLQGKRGMREEGVVAPPCAAHAIRPLLLTTMEDVDASGGIHRAGSMGCRYRKRCC